MEEYIFKMSLNDILKVKDTIDTSILTNLGFRLEENTYAGYDDDYTPGSHWVWEITCNIENPIDKTKPVQADAAIFIAVDEDDNTKAQGWSAWYDDDFVIDSNLLERTKDECFEQLKNTLVAMYYDLIEYGILEIDTSLENLKKSAFSLRH